jgi:hypothetical protein
VAREDAGARGDLWVIADEAAARARAGDVLDAELGAEAAAALRARGIVRADVDASSGARLSALLGEIAGARSSFWPLRPGVEEVDGAVRWIESPAPMAEVPAGSELVDAYADGLGLILELSRPALDRDIEVADAAHQLWCSTYQSDVFQAFRNTDVDATVGGRTIRLWADRIRDPDGSESARKRLAWIGRELATLLPVARWRVGAPHDGGVDEEIERRLGTPVLTMHPGGDLVAQARAAGALPPGSPSWAPLIALIVVVARLVAGRALDAAIAAPLVSALGVIGISIATRRWCRSTELAMAVISVSVSLVRVAAGIGGGGESLAWLLVEAGAILAWYFVWSRRMRAMR